MPQKIEISKSYIVPRHEVLGESDVASLLQEYNITVKQLPRILESDPMVREINAKAGDVIKITRRSPTAGEAVYYRFVVEGEL